MLNQQPEQMKDEHILFRITWHEDLARMFESKGHPSQGREFRDLAAIYRRELERRQRSRVA